MQNKPSYKDLEKRINDLENELIENKKITNDLKEKEIYFRSLYEKAPLGYQSLDENGFFIDVNYEWLHLFGYKREEIIGKSFGDFLHPDWIDHFKENFPRFKAVGEVLGVEFEMRKKDGSYRLVSFNGKIGRDDKGAFKQTHCILKDITKQKQAEAALEKIEWMLLKGHDSSCLKRTFNPEYGNPGRKKSGLILNSVGEEMLTDIVGDYLDLLETSAAVYEKNGDYAIGIFSSGWCRYLDESSFNLCKTDNVDSALKSGKWLCHESCWGNASKKAVKEKGPVDVKCFGGLNIYAIPVYANDDIIGSINFGYGDPPSDLDEIKDISLKYNVSYEKLVNLSKDYESRPPFLIEVAKKRLHVSAILIGKIIEHKIAEMEFKESEAKMRSIFRAAPVGIGFTIDRVFKDVNERFCEMTGFLREDLLDKNSTRIYPTIEEYENAGKIKYEMIKKTGTGSVETKFKRKNGSIIDVILSSTPIDTSDLSKGVIFTALDISGIKKVQRDLEESHERFLTVLNSIDATIYVADMETYEIIFMNNFMIESFGRDMTGEICWKAFRGEDGPCENCTNAFLLAKDGKPKGVWVWQGKNPLTKRVYVNYDRAVKWTDGRVVRLQVATDITDLKDMEEQLRQAQKMESIGRLAGGIAHDFNNMLAIILGNVEMSLSDIESDHPVAGYLSEIQKASLRSADFTKQLLAFARKQAVNPKVLDLNSTLKNMLKMLTRLMGENIELVYKPEPGLWHIRIDPAQVDQILTNLCINSRDAIKGVGRVFIETGNKSFDHKDCSVNSKFRPGEYVMISVCDNGVGMDTEIIDNLFEPFFTTKDTGKGTGLGLATVYGIVKQNNGFIDVYSEPYAGTTFKIYFPRDNSGLGNNEIKKQGDELKKGSELILLVEDEKPLLKMTKKILVNLGYKVVSASCPSEGIELAKEYRGKIDLILSDVIMPEMNGIEMSEKIIENDPKVKCLFMSGYTKNAVENNGLLKEGCNFLNKPFGKNELAESIRTVIDTEKVKEKKN